MTMTVVDPVRGTRTLDLRLCEPVAYCHECSWRDDGNQGSAIGGAKDHAEQQPGHRVHVIRTTDETITWQAAGNG